MHLNCVLVSIFVIIFNLVYSTAYKPRHGFVGLHGDTKNNIMKNYEESNKTENKFTRYEANDMLFDLNDGTKKGNGADGKDKVTITPKERGNNSLSTKDPKDRDDGTSDDEEVTKESKDLVKEHAFKKYHAEKISRMQENMGNIWPLGIISYKFDTSSFDNILALRVRDAMDFLESASCVQFKAIAESKNSNYSWIHITNPGKQRECSHKPKKKSSGEIVLILGLECLNRRNILHSLLHAIGFADEVTHPQRDQYIRIMWENMQPKYQHLFVSSPREDKQMVEYDPMSIMHFHDRAFSKNGQATIVPLMPGLQIQPSEKLSQLDKMKLRLAFGHECNRRTVGNLFDTCKSVMHKQSEMEDVEESQDLSQDRSNRANDNEAVSDGQSRESLSKAVVQSKKKLKYQNNNSEIPKTVYQLAWEADIEPAIGVVKNKTKNKKAKKKRRTTTTTDSSTPNIKFQKGGGFARFVLKSFLR